MKYMMVKNRIFAIISVVSILLTIPAFVIDLSTTSMKMQETFEDDFLDTIAFSHDILNRCNLTEEQRNNISAVLFESKREVELNDNLNNAQIIFNTVRGELEVCEPMPVDHAYSIGPSPVILFIPLLVLISIIFAIIWVVQKRRNRNNLSHNS